MADDLFISDEELLGSFDEFGDSGSSVSLIRDEDILAAAQSDISEIPEEDPTILESAFEFGQNVVDESFRSLSSTFSTTGRAEDSFLAPLQTDLGEEQGGIANVASQGLGQFLTGGGLVAGAALATGPVGAGIAGGAFLIQQIRSEIRNVEDEVLQRTGNEELAAEAGANAGLVIAATEAIGFAGGPLGRLVENYIPTRTLTKLVRGQGDEIAEVGADAVAEVSDELAKTLTIAGDARRVLGQTALGFGVEGATEVVQEGSQRAIVETAVDPSLDSGDIFAEFLKSEDALDVFIGAGLVGGLRGGVEMFSKPESERTPEETASLELASDIKELADPDSSTTSIAIQPDLFSAEAVEQVVQTVSEQNPELDLSVSVEPDGQVVIETTEKQLTTEDEVVEVEAEATQPATVSDEAQPNLNQGVARTIQGKELPFERRSIALDDLVVQKDLPNFKRGADEETGVVGDPRDFPTEFDPIQAGNIVVIEKKNGELEVLSGRNRFAIAKSDPTVDAISAVVVKESDGFTLEDAAILDTELNIRDNFGQTEDFAKFFEATEKSETRESISEDVARRRGLLRNRKGRRGFFIGTKGSDELRAAFFNNKITEAAASAITRFAPNNPDLQRVGTAVALKGGSAQLAVDTMKAQIAISGKGILTQDGGIQGDLFGGDSASRDALTLGEAAVRLRRATEADARLLKQALRFEGQNIAERFPDLVGRFDISDPDAVRSEIARLEDRIDRFRRWPSEADLLKEVTQEALATAGANDLTIDVEALTPVDSIETIEPTPIPPAQQVAEGEMAIVNRIVPAEGVAKTTTEKQALDLFDSNSEIAKSRKVSDEQKQSVTPPSTKRVVPEGISAASIRAFRERRESQRIREGGAADPREIEIFGESLYLPITNRDTIAEIQEKIQRNGLLPSAMDVIAESYSPELRGALKVAFVKEVQKQIRTATRQARVDERFVDLEMFSNILADVDHIAAELGTESAQTLQAFSSYADSPREAIFKSIEKLRRKFFKDRGRSYSRLPDSVLDEIDPLLDRLDLLPENSLFARDLERQILVEVARSDGVSAADVITAMWYANVLSGFNTQAINIAGNGINLFLRTLGTSIAQGEGRTGLGFNPQATYNMMLGLIEGASQGIDEGRAALKGQDISKTMRKNQIPSALEVIDESSPAWRRVVSYGKFVFRALGAGDAFFYRTAREGRAYLAAAQAAQKIAADSDSVTYAEALADQLHNSTYEAQQAMEQARQEVEIAGIEATELDIRRRTYEILEQNRPEQVRMESHIFGEFATYTNPPDGSMGHIARAINNIIQGVELDTRIGRFQVVRVVVPFVNIVANVASSSLDFTPIGLWRWQKGGKIFGKQFQSPQARKDAMGNFIIGTMGTAMILSAVEAYIDDDDPAIAIYGAGPKDFKRHKQMREQGWQPFTIKIGDTYIRYNETPLAVIFAALGSYYDGLRYKDQRSSLEKLAYSISGGAGAFLEAGFLKGVADILDVMRGRKKASPTLLGLTRGFIPAQGLARDIGKMTHPELVDTKDSAFWAAIIKDIPLAQTWGTRPALNAFGEPVVIGGWQQVPFFGRFLSSKSEDPRWEWIAENGLRLPSLQDKVTIPVGQSRRDKARLSALRDDRLETLGRVYFDTFTPDEHYEYVERQGVKVAKIVEELMNSDLTGEALQDELNKAVIAARKDTKLEMMGIPVRRRVRRGRR